MADDIPSLWTPEGQWAEREWRTRFENERHLLLARSGAMNSTATYGQIAAAAVRLFNEISDQLRARIEAILSQSQNPTWIRSPDEVTKLTLDPLVRSATQGVPDAKRVAAQRGFQNLNMLQGAIQPHQIAMTASAETVRSQIRNAVRLRLNALEPKHTSPTKPPDVDKKVTLTFRKTNLRTDETVLDGTVSATFTPDQQGRLAAYHQYAERLRNCPLVTKGLPELQNATLDDTSGWSFAFTPFDWNDVHGALHLARPLILTGEPSSFDRIRGILAKEFSQPEVREYLGKLLKRYQDGFYKNSVQIQVGTTSIFDESTFMTWLNARQYHTDLDKQEFVGKISAVLGKDADSLIALHLFARIDAALELDQNIVQRILPQFQRG